MTSWIHYGEYLLWWKRLYLTFLLELDLGYAPGLAKEPSKRLNTRGRCHIQETSDLINKRGKWIRGLVVIYWIGYLGWQLWIFFHMNADFYDAFDNLRDARALTGTHLGYQIFRPPLIPILHAPLQKALDLFHTGAVARLRIPHLFQCLLSIGCLIAVFRYLRLSFSSGWAHLGIILFSLNRLTIHYFGAVLSDIPSALFLVLFLQEWDANPILAAVALGCCLLTRWSMPALLLAALVWQAIGKEGAFIPRLKTAAFGILISIGICGAVYCLMGGLSPILVLRLLATYGLSVFQGAGDSHSFPYWTYFRGLYKSAGILSIVFFLVGLRASLQKEGAAHRLAAVLLIFYVCLMSVIGFKEIRYLYCVLPFFYCLVLLGLTRIYSRFGRFIPSSAHLPLTVLLVAVSGIGAMEEWSRFRDPAYTDPILFDTFNAVENNIRPGAKIFWTGSAYSLYPKNHIFIPEDPYYYLFHTPNPGSLEYLLGRQVPSMDDAVLKTVRDGDIMIRSPRRHLMFGVPWDATENHIEVVQRSGTQWKRLAILPKGS